jgi:hypothetical protein
MEKYSSEMLFPRVVSAYTAPYVRTIGQPRAIRPKGGKRIAGIRASMRGRLELRPKCEEVLLEGCLLLA